MLLVLCVDGMLENTIPPNALDRSKGERLACPADGEACSKAETACPKGELVCPK